MKPFIYSSQPGRIVFGAGSLEQLEPEIERLRATRVVVLSTPGQRGSAEDIARRLGARCAGIFAGAVIHVPIEAARAARAEIERLNVDCVVSMGGGSTIGLGKAIALEANLPILAIPTTYSGSEVTPIYGITERGVKRTGRDARVLPRTVIYDPTLTLGLPVELSATSGINAIAHAVEGLYAPDTNPIMSLLAEEGIRALAQALPKVVVNPGDLAARSDCLYGAWLCGTVLGNVGMGLHHKLCHTLGGTWNLPHAETHTIVLPHATAYNQVAAPEAMERIARALNASTAAAGLYDLARQMNTPLALEKIGMPYSDLDRAAELATANPYWNPRPIERVAIRQLLDDAWHGRRPG